MAMAQNKVIRLHFGHWDSNKVDRARNKAKKLGEIKNSILKGGGNVAGYLCEEAVASYINAKITSCNKGTDKSDYDITTQDGRRVEIKTKRRTVSCICEYGPNKGSDQGHYEVSVAKTSVHQRPDLYIFVNIHFKNVKEDAEGKRLYYNIENIEILGQMKPEDYFAKAKLVQQGDHDASNNFTAHTDMYNLHIRDLEPLDDSLLPQKQ